MRLVRVRFEKPLPAFGHVEYKDGPDCSITWEGGAVTLAVGARSVIVPWSRVVEAEAYVEAGSVRGKRK